MHADAETHPVRLLLTMIVRDEAAIIDRCLDSAFPLVDGYAVCDTGSRDGTPARIRACAARHGVPGVVVEDRWIDFGSNRTRSAAVARGWARARGWCLERTYLLLLDADMVLAVGDGFDPAALVEPAYYVAQDDGETRYLNLRLLRLDHAWEAVGATHEYWRSMPEAARCGRLETLAIDDRADGASRVAKYERDEALLRADLERDPADSRALFYLAQTLYDLGRWAEAEPLYARRHALGGWPEEAWYARYRQGSCLLRMGEIERAGGVLLDAFDQRPERAEPLWVLARRHREECRYESALMLALRGLEIPYPASDLLFVERPVYQWRLWEEVMASALHCHPRYRAFGLDACDRLLALPGIDDAGRRHARAYRAIYDPAPMAAGGLYDADLGAPAGAEHPHPQAVP